MIGLNSLISLVWLNLSLTFMTLICLKISCQLFYRLSPWGLSAVSRAWSFVRFLWQEQRMMLCSHLSYQLTLSVVPWLIIKKALPERIKDWGALSPTWGFCHFRITPLPQRAAVRQNFPDRTGLYTHEPHNSHDFTHKTCTRWSQTEPKPGWRRGSGSLSPS